MRRRRCPRRRTIVLSGAISFAGLHVRRHYMKAIGVGSRCYPRDRRGVMMGVLQREAAQNGRDTGARWNGRDPSAPLSKNEHLLKWVDKMARLTRPNAIHWVDGSQAEYDTLCADMVASGTMIKLNEELWPGCYYARS